MQAIDKLPVVPGVLELVGIGYTGVSYQFSQRHIASHLVSGITMTNCESCRLTNYYGAVLLAINNVPTPKNWIFFSNVAVH